MTRGKSTTQLVRIPDEFTKYERARILGSRALQIAMGAPSMLKLTPEQLEAMNYSSLEIAKQELGAGLIPIVVKRPLPPKHSVHGAHTPEQEKQ
ncbi:TPA: DNA-directed RNA polymerase subunit K [Candidatus Woesearchaeota archaeon]|nr:DNA-directed RNA polymerase subunit K [Candidatus Woesearchaeota archaeon]HIH47340.1 DNA-directed RNA polymerase subunit K [Candidatus Woesearchaeota archaeon]HII87976.1 DNA-directed RNA polymerase subunit K [Candidatus Woesearchaeota archaeon]